MVVGHTLDALLSPAARLHPAAVGYWKARGLTAPLFLLVAGWAVTVAIRRGRARGAAIVRERLPRVLLLLAVGVALRWPGWGSAGLWAGDPAVWAHLLAFDALQVIAVAFLGAALVFAAGRPPLEERLLFALLVVVAVTFGMRAPPPLPAGLAALAWEQLVGGSSPFPLFPWVGYFYAGCLVGLGVGDGSRRATLGLAGLGAALVLATFWQGIGTAPPGEPALIAFRVGAILLLLAALAHLPARVAAALAPVGRLSLAVYALHVPVVYGWSTVPGLAWRIGPRLGAAGALGVALLVLLASVAAAWLLALAWRTGARLAAAARQRTSAAR
ncbi:MAG: acyltransferase family protein [Anaeromyxobacter sp.]|nr:acyltransferase family protein [Anaeromyxobacter sp.]MBL0276226.1 acyltransferase family protein [Anaeromyxobacter sp.]